MSAPLLVNQRTALAILGWSSKRYIDFLRRKSVRHARDGRLFVARVSDVFAALGLADEPQQPATPEWSTDDVVRQLHAGRR